MSRKTKVLLDHEMYLTIKWDLVWTSGGEFHVPNVILSTARGCGDLLERSGVRVGIRGRVWGATGTCRSSEKERGKVCLSSCFGCSTLQSPRSQGRGPLAVTALLGFGPSRLRRGLTAPLHKRKPQKTRTPTQRPGDSGVWVEGDTRTHGHENDVLPPVGVSPRHSWSLLLQTTGDTRDPTSCRRVGRTSSLRRPKAWRTVPWGETGGNDGALHPWVSEPRPLRVHGVHTGRDSQRLETRTIL